MGVPKFYRWISERYPKINQVISDSALLPEFDHLYLDMNGIIHGCTHPSHLDISDVLSERDMMLGIMQYLDRIITQIVKPKVSVYMAIDGVAPRAKLNQQRSRRFRSAKDMAEATKDLKDINTTEGSSAVFDSNCITPGTEFLAKVSDTIQYFIRKKIKEDPIWHNLTVIFSGADIPGEGEHKIMQHIREMRSQRDYQPNTRHCIYGQDADLIMLGLVTHEPHFTILREVIDFSFSFNNNNQNTLKAVKKFTKESDFQLLHLSVLREYLQIEFCYQYPQFDLERCIDDFVFMTFLVGNDFLPHMPTLDIGDGAFDLLFDIYKEQRRAWGEGHYLTESGSISDPHRLEVFLAAVGAVENDILEEREKNEAAYLKKKRRWDRRDGNPEGPSDADLKAEESAKQNDYMSMIEDLMAKVEINEASFVDGWQPVAAPGEKDYKGRYYYEKLKLTPLDKGDHWALRKSYVEGLMWCLAYYYRGCISWGWFYPYHYGPMLSDLIDIPRMFEEIQFELGEPLTPFQQLMGCLPPASSALVPKLYRWLMESPESPIIQFYPKVFEVDMNGKKNPWEGVNLLPFIDIDLLKETVAKHCPVGKLGPNEAARNTRGRIYCYKYDITCTDTVGSPNTRIGLPDIVGSHSSIRIVDEPEDGLDLAFAPKLVDGTQIPYPGFPSLNVLPIASVDLTNVGLNCFGSPSKYPSMILSLHKMPELAPIDHLADAILGKSIFVNWPMMHEAFAVAISDDTKEIRLVKNKRKETIHSTIAAERWLANSDIMYQMYHIGNGVPGSGGVDIGAVRLRLKVLPLQGMKTNPANGSTKKLFGRQEADVPLQLCLLQAPAPDPRFVERGPMTLQDRFPINSSVVLTKGKYRGCCGKVVGIADKKNVAVGVGIVPAELPFGLAIARGVQESYISSIDAARILKMHPGLFGKVTGRLQFEQGRYDLGLNLKSADGICVVGYTRRRREEPGGVKAKSLKNRKQAAWSAGDSLLVIGSEGKTDDENREERIQWEYTPKAVRLVATYKKKFPQLFAELAKDPNEKKYDATKVFGPNGESWLPVVREWLNNHESAKMPRTPTSTDSMSAEAVAAVEKAASVRALALKDHGYPKESLIKVPGSALYREGSTGATDVLLAADLNNNEAPSLGDRIVNLCADGIPFGARGTVVGIHEAATTGSVEVVMDEEFIGGSSLQGTCSNFRGKLCMWAHLLKVTPPDSEKFVDKFVPKGSGRAAVDKILASVDTQVKSSWDSQVDSTNLSYTGAHNSRGASVPNGPTAVKTVVKVTSGKLSSSKPRPNSRSGSSGRGKQGTWREARGPDEKDIGFRGSKKKGENGYSRWKKLVSSGPTSTDDSRHLKAILGVSEPGTWANGTTVGTAELKALLGVAPQSAESTSTPFAVASGSPGDGLKAMLAVSGTSAPDPLSAADKLMQVMTTRQPMSHPVQMPIPQLSGFNFTYVEEGHEETGPAVTVAMPPANVPPSFRPETAIPNTPSFPRTALAPGLDEWQFPALGSVPTPTSAARASPACRKDSGVMVPSVVAAGKSKR